MVLIQKNNIYILNNWRMKICGKGKMVLYVSLLMVTQLLPAQILTEETFKIGKTLTLIEEYYVDTSNISRLTEKAITEMLRDLDPHSTYISAKDVREMNEPLLGNFEGIGIQFNVLRDTIIVVEPLSGGPSEKVGLLAGDRIISINGEKVAGTGISTNGVRSRLLGPKGTIVNINVFRKGEKDILDFTITRDKISINSLDAAYMLNDETGYVRLNKFAATTDAEFIEALVRLKNENMKNIIIDLRGNGGGFMTSSTQLVNHFFSDERLLVYLSGRKTPRQDYKSSGSGNLSSARLVILTDDGSASASEIVAGAVQDWDRGVIIGRRTFGKGLVQNAFYLNDGSMIRLSVARYYTPSGRSIQSPYNKGYEKYLESYARRFTNGEMMSADSIRFPDSLRFKTLVNKRTVYGGGGIMPDVFVAVDTSNYSDYYRTLVRRGIFNSFMLDYADKNRAVIISRHKTFDDFMKKFVFPEEDIRAFIRKGEEAGIKYVDDQYKKSESEILMVLKALLANNIWQTNEYFRIINENDNVLAEALKVISDEKLYNKILGY